MTREETPPIVRVERAIAAPPERVFAAWIDPAQLAAWMSPVGHAEAEVDAQVGGELRITMIGDGRRIEHRGQYREVVPGRRLVFTWSSPYTGSEPSIVTVELEPIETGTIVRLIHERLPADAVEAHRNGWTPMLERLAALFPIEPSGGDRWRST